MFLTDYRSFLLLIENPQPGRSAPLLMPLIEEPAIRSNPISLSYAVNSGLLKDVLLRLKVFVSSVLSQVERQDLA